MLADVVTLGLVAVPLATLIIAVSTYSLTARSLSTRASESHVAALQGQIATQAQQIEKLQDRMLRCEQARQALIDENLELMRKLVTRG